MKRRTSSGIGLLACLAWLAMTGLGPSTSRGAEPVSVFDSTLCRLLGCAVVSNGQQWQLYVLTGESGRRARLWASQDGRLDMGTLEAAQRLAPGADQGTALGIDLDGDRQADWHIQGGDEGFLDAGSSLPAFPLTATTELTLAQREVHHTFWVASNVPLSLHGEVRWTRQEGDLADQLDSDDVDVSLDLGEGSGGLPSGVETEGRRFLADLVGGPQPLVTFRRGTFQSGAAELQQHMVRIALTYRFAGYDLSQGTGELGADIEYSLHTP